MSGLSSIVPVLPLFILAWRIRALIRRFRELHAASPESAVPLEALKVRRSVIFRRLVRRGVIVSTGEERYYLDEGRYQNWRVTRRRRALMALAVVGGIALVAWLMGWLRP